MTKGESLQRFIDAARDVKEACDSNDERLEAVVIGVSLALSAAVTWSSKNNGYAAAAARMESTLREVGDHSREYLARMHKQPMRERADDELTTLRKSIGRLYGMARDMEKRSS